MAVYAMLLGEVSPPVSDVHGGSGHKCGEVESGCDCRPSGMMSMCGKDLSVPLGLSGNS